MRISVMLSLALLLLLTVPIRADFDTPLMNSVEPLSGSIGDVFAVTGENLDDVHVAAVYLTDGKNDIKTVIVEQTATTIKFKVPPEAKPGRFAVMVLTKGKAARYIEEPVKVTIEAPAKPSS
jgi:IPT/TIG domain-containing protein